MNKTSNINLSGKLFHVDEPAFEKLHAYSERLKKCYAGSNDGFDIINDVEARMSELLSLKLQKEGRSIVSMEDVDHLITQLGEPESFEDNINHDTHISADESQFTTGNKRLFRNPNDAIVAGICSGLSAFLGIKDPLWLRLALVLLVILGVGTPILIYILLWFIVPEAKTSAQKLDMQGKPVNLASLENTVKTKWDEVSNANNGTLRTMVSFIGKAIMYFIIGFIALIIGIILLSFGIAALAMIIAGIVSFGPINTYVLESPVQGIMPILGLVLLGGSLFVFFILLPFHVFSRTKKILTVRKITTIAITAIMGLLLLGAGSASIAGLFGDKGKVKQAFNYSVNPTDTLKISTLSGRENEDINVTWGFNKEDYSKIEKSGEICKVKFNIESSPDAQLHIIQSNEARAKSNSLAEKYASMINHKFSVIGNDIRIADYLTTNNSQKKFRFQEANITLQIPQGQYFVLSDEICDILEDYPPLQESTITDDYDLSDVVWQMEGNSLKFISVASGFNHDTSAQYNINGFTDIEEVHLSGKMEVNIVQGSEYKLYTSLPEEKIDIVFNGGILEVTSRNKFLSGKKLKVFIEMPMISGISAAGNIVLNTKGFRGENLNVESAGNNDISLKDMSYGEMEISNTGTGRVLLSGSVNTLESSSTGTSVIDARNLEASEVLADASGASEIWIFAKDAINADASGASTVHYKGTDNIVNNVSGVSKIITY
jgi:phage shock protein PspC (stress-responsive transcriptional regulator)